jgi:hypothetical protein
MAARDYAVTGRGGTSFDGQVDFTATLVASERLTADVVRSVKEARYLTASEGGRLTIPFRFVGRMPGVKPVPDAEWVMRTVGRAAVGTGMEKLLEKFGGQQPPSGKPAGKPAPGAKEPTPEERLRKGLGGFLGR